MPNNDPRTDSELVSLTLGGDKAAFASIYDRYADRLHSYCFVMLRDPHAAADATHDAFVKAATRLSQLRDPSKLRPWLFSIARNEALAEGRRRQRQAPVEDLSEELVSDPDPSYGLAQAELKELVWSAVAGLQERDRDLMTLHLVEGLDGADLAEAMGVQPAHLHVMLSRMRDRVEKALGALLIARLGRDDCNELAALLSDWDGKFTLEVRSKVTRHVESCDVCDEKRSALVSPAALLPSVVFVPAPAAVRTLVLTDVDPALASMEAASGSGPAVSSGSASKSARLAKAGLAALVVAAAMILGVGSGTVLMKPEPPAVSPVVSLTSSTTAPPTTVTTTTLLTTTTTSTTTTAPAPPAPAMLRVDRARIDFGSTLSTATVVLTNTGEESTEWVVGRTDGTFTVRPGRGILGAGESATVTVGFGRSEVGEGDRSRTVTFSSASSVATVDLIGSVERNPVISDIYSPYQVVYAVSGDIVCAPTIAPMAWIVADESPIATVLVRWWDGLKMVEVPAQSEGNDSYFVEVGPFSAAGSGSPTIVATDTRGNSRTAVVDLAVESC
ncbi:MAG: sigma-70 family RNA polymerase sigma factor [Acidimicrobiia bacterium]